MPNIAHDNTVMVDHEWNAIEGLLSLKQYNTSDTSLSTSTGTTTTTQSTTTSMLPQQPFSTLLSPSAVAAAALPMIQNHHEQQPLCHYPYSTSSSSPATPYQLPSINEFLLNAPLEPFQPHQHPQLHSPGPTQESILVFENEIKQQQQLTRHHHPKSSNSGNIKKLKNHPRRNKKGTSRKSATATSTTHANNDNIGFASSAHADTFRESGIQHYHPYTSSNSSSPSSTTTITTTTSSITTTSLKPRWQDIERQSLIDAIIKEKNLDDMSSIPWDKISKLVGRAKKSCKDQWRREMLPYLLNFFIIRHPTTTTDEGVQQRDEEGRQDAA